MRVCGAEVERTLQKGGGGFEFAIKNIVYRSLSPSFSPLKFIISCVFVFLRLKVCWGNCVVKKTIVVILYNYLFSPSLAILSFSFMWMVNLCQIDQTPVETL